MLLSVLTITYNQETYIANTIEGILNQKIDFEFEYIISDDCSRDSTSKIVEHYINNHPKGSFIKYIKQPKRLGVKKNFLTSLKSCKGKYIALCEGDDYWCNNDKLKIQLKILENNDNISMVFHNTLDVDTINGHNQLRFEKDKELCINSSLLLESCFPRTCSVVFRSSSLHLNAISKIYFFDWILFYNLSLNGKLFYLKKPMAIYRLHNNGEWNKTSPRSNIKKGTYILSFYFTALFFRTNFKNLSFILFNIIKYFFFYLQSLLSYNIAQLFLRFSVHFSSKNLNSVK